MSDVFLPAPLGETEVQHALFASVPVGEPAHLADTRLCGALGGLAPVLADRPGERVAGRLVRLHPDGLARLEFLMAGLSAARRQVTAEAGQGLRRAEAFYSSEPAPPSLPAFDRWSTAQRLQFMETIEEALGHFGHRAAAEMPRLLPGIAVRALARARARMSDPPSRVGAGLGAADVALTRRAYPYAGYFGVEELTLRHRRFDGRMSDPIERGVFTAGDAVTVLPFDPRRRLVLVIEQFRAGVHARRDPRPWMLEVVAGRCDARESTEAAARREAREEAGIEIGRMERIADYYTSPGVTAEFITAYVGEADLGGAGGVHGLASESEDINVHVLPLATALELAQAGGEARNAPLLISLLWLAANAQRLAGLWAGARVDGGERSG